jgi:hypothetical protein
MDVPNSEVGYTSATTGRGDLEIRKGHVVGLEKNNAKCLLKFKVDSFILTPSLIFPLFYHCRTPCTFLPNSKLLCLPFNAGIKSLRATLTADIFYWGF